MKIRLTITTLLLFLAGSLHTHARQVEYDSAERIRTTFLIHVARYTVFPDSTTEANDRSFCFLENTDGEHYLEFKEILARYSIKSVNLTPIQLGDHDEFEQHQCDFAFVDEEKESQQVFAMLENKRDETIFVGETNRFIENGGLISLIERQAKVRVFINQQKYRGGVIRFSSKLLKHSKFR